MKVRKFKPQINSKKVGSEDINIMKLISPYLKRWYFLVGGVSLMLLMAYFYVRYSIPRYEVSSRVLLRVDEGSKSNINLDVLDGEPFFSNSSSIEDELEIFKGHSVLGPVVDSLNLRISTFVIGENSGIRRAEVFEELPFKIKLLTEGEIAHRPIQLKLTWKKTGGFIDLNGKIFNFKGDTVFSFNDDLPKISLQKSECNGKIKQGDFEITLSSKEDAINSLAKSLKIEKASKESNIVNISMSGFNQVKIASIISSLVKSYQRDVATDRSEIKINTISFIEDRMRYLVKELEDVEKTGESYKVNTGINDYSTNLTNSLTSQSSLEVKLKESEIQLGLIKYLSEYLETANSDEDLLPSNLGLSDINVNALIEQYNKSILEKSKLSATSKSSNPLIQNLESQAKMLKTNIEKSLKNLRKSTQSKVDEYTNMVNGLDGELRSLPKFEREYRSILRQQQIKETLYLYLLQKREENEIELAANTSTLKVLTPPSTRGTYISPKKNIIYLGASILGAILPVFFIYISLMINNKIAHDTSIEPLAEIGRVPNTKVEGLIRGEIKDGLLVESFKAIRTNLYFYLGENKKVIGVTSSLPDEGKTFVSLNIADAIRQTGKKVVLVGTDLRRSGSEIFFPNLNEIGLSSYLTRSELTIHDVITPIDTDFCMIHKGISPPNPSELLLRPRMDELIEELKKEFDIIVIDTSPVDVVSDCLPVLKKYADFILFVVKCGSTPVEALNTPKRLLEEGIVENLAVVKNNSIRQSKSYYGSYYY